MLLGYSITVFLLVNVSFAQPLSDNTGDALVAVNKETPKTNEELTKGPRTPHLKSMNVNSYVRSRYARTVVSSKYINSDKRSQQAKFSIILPDTAFIAKFVMETDGKKYEAYVREKKQAKKEYEQAVARGQGAAHVATSARDSNKFTISVNVEPQSKVIFDLTYEELLVRKHGKYEIIINLHPGQIIKNFGVDVRINESRPIINVETPTLRSGNEITNDDTENEYAIVSKNTDGLVHVSFHPTTEQQMKMARELKNIHKEGISGQFVVKYDVERDPHGGEVLINDGYFVHFFAPSELKPIPKHVVFVLDVSSSMAGRKMEQLKEAMVVILGELKPKDCFNLVKFHSTVHVMNNDGTWNYITIPSETNLPSPTEATGNNIKNAQEVVRKMSAEGATNIYDGLKVGLKLTGKGLSNLNETSKHKPQPMIIFLTDGQPNVAESKSDKIIEMVEQRNGYDNKVAIFALAFGNDADNEFLKELALKNSGFSKQIYEAADASLQLQDFYKQITSPLLTNVHFKYTEEQVKEITKHNFKILFNGSELVVAGKSDNVDFKNFLVEGSTAEGINIFYPKMISVKSIPEIKDNYGSLERLWAYLTIKQLLNTKYEEKVHDTNNDAGKQALKLALKYSFVTPVTSIVVVKPNKTDSLAEVEEAMRRSNYMEYDDYDSGSNSRKIYNSMSFAVRSSAGMYILLLPIFVNRIMYIFTRYIFL